MGLLDGVLGNAAKIDPTKIQQEFAQILAPGEQVEHAYKLMRDYFVFTGQARGHGKQSGVSLDSVQEHHSL